MSVPGAPPSPLSGRRSDIPARPEGVPNKPRMLAGPPGIQPLLDPAPDRMRCSDLAVLLQDHCLEYDEPLRFPLPVPHPLHLGAEHPDKPAANLPTRRAIAPRWHDRKVTPPHLPRRVVSNSAVEMRARVPVNPVPVDLLET